MSIEPPKTGRSTGPIVILVFISIILLAAMAIFGMLAFDILPGRSGPAAPDPSTALTASDFDVVSTASGADSATVLVDLLVKNSGEDPVEDAQVLVQCEDGGYVSALRNVPRLESEAEIELQMQLNGTGHPECTSPDISFSSVREED